MDLSKKQITSLIKEHPWLRVHSGSIEEYIHPQHYERLLKEYIFSGKADLEYFDDDLKFLESSDLRILELGSGSGRATDIFLKKIKKFKKLDLVDLSPHMVRWLEKKYGKNTKVTEITADSIDYLETTKRYYDYVFSLWSFSHSIHQHMEKDGVKKASKYIRKNLINFFSNKLNPGGKFFLIHFDSRSDEQRILMKQWSKFFPTFKVINKQSPSKLLLDDTFKYLEKKGVIQKLRIKHLTGQPIVYESLEEALEIFINFHMETEFNRSPYIKEILREVSSDMSKYRRKDRYYIKPGCFIYTFQRPINSSDRGLC